MPNEYTKIRRAELAQDDSWVKAFLHRASFGATATVCNGQPFITNTLFVYDEEANAIYMHTSRHGRLFHNVVGNNNDRVCFSTARMGRLLPADKASGVDVEYASAVVFGRIGLINDQDEACRVLHMLLGKYFPDMPPDKYPVTDEDVERTAVYRIRIEQWSGKQSKDEDDNPGAFFFKDLQV